MEDEELTEEVYDETTITKSPRWGLEVCFSVGEFKENAEPCGELTGVRVGVAEVENGRIIEVDGNCKRKKE